MTNRTKRLLIRTWTPNDVEALCALTRQEGLSEFSVSGYLNFTEEQATQWIQKEILRFKNHRLAKFAVALKDTDELIGISGLFQMPPPNESSIELNYRYPRKYRGFGYATEAAQAILDYGFNTLGLRQINANADFNNKASQAVLARLGMRLIGEVTYHGIRAGRWAIDRDK